MPSIAVPQYRPCYNLLPFTTSDQLGDDRLAARFIHPLGTRIRRPPRLMEGDRRPFAPRREDGAALGETRRDAGPPAPSRQDGVGLCFPDRARQVGTESQA